MPAQHILGNLLLIVLLGFAGVLLARSKRSAGLGILLSGAVALLAVTIAVRPDIIVAVVPYRDLTFYQNLYPLAGALFIPCVWWFVKSRGQRVRMALWCGLLLVMSFIPYSYHFSAQAFSGGTFFDEDGVCIQSSDTTCSAASVVTLLHTYGVSTTEAQAVEIARTKLAKGTQSLGLYRALRYYAEKLDGREAVLRHLTLDTLLDRTEPAIVLVGLPARGHSSTAAAFGRDNNWPVGIYHDVVFLGRDPEHADRVLIADPDMGLESWPVDHMRYLFRGVSVMFERD